VNQTWRDYLAELKGKRIAVLGIGVSNTPLIELLLAAGLPVTACDRRDKEALGGLTEHLERKGACLRLGKQYLDDLDQDIIFRTPGMRPDLPQMLAAQARGSVITSEMEVFFRVCPCPILAVTGSDGKTTTTTIISELLKAAGYTVHTGGNIGKPLLPEADNIQPEDLAVLELSSFQLMTMQDSPQVAVVTNIAPNHLDVHKSMQEYIDAKENLIRWQKPVDHAVLNQDNEITRQFAARAKGQVTLFSRQTPLERGVFWRNNAIWLANESGERKILDRDSILLPGDHNVENYMAAIAAVQGRVPDDIIRTFAAQFSGVEHRIELVRELNGVRYYNDSIASSPTRTIAGLRSFQQQVILIAGGYDKKIPFDALGPEIAKKVKYLYLMGDTADKIRAAVENADGYAPGKPEIQMCADLAEAVAAAHKTAQPGDVVILSPACASFDRFPNFMVRGETFKTLVRSLEGT